MSASPLLPGALLTASVLLAVGWVLLLTLRGTSAALYSTAARLLMAATLGAFVWSVGAHPDFRKIVVFAQSKRAAVERSAEKTEDSAGATRRMAITISGDSADHKEEETNAALGLILTISPERSRAIAALWLAGMASVWLRWLAGRVRRAALARHSRPVNEAPWLSAAADGVTGRGLAREIRLHPGEVMPCAWGVRRGVILLPASAVDWPVEKTRLVLAHECAHLLRRDPLWQLVGQVFRGALWFHPLAWNLSRRAQAADERAADDTVVRATADAPAYAGLLVECARFFPTPDTMKTTTIAMSCRASSLTTRVESVLDPRADRRPAGTAATARLAAAAACLTALAIFAAPTLQAAPDSTSTEMADVADLKNVVADHSVSIGSPAEVTPAVSSRFKTVIVDAGHGGLDAGGMTKEGKKESTYNLDTAKRLQTSLEKDGFRVVMTRTEDIFLRLSQRMEIVDKIPDAILIGLHFDNLNNGAARGVVVAIPEGDAAKPGNSALSVALASAVHSQFQDVTLPEISHRGFKMLRSPNTLASIIVNGGNMANPLEAAKIATEAYRETLAQAIAKGVRAFAAGREE